MKLVKFTHTTFIPEAIAKKLNITDDHDDRLNIIIYDLIQDFEDKSKALNCLSASLYSECKSLGVNPIEIAIALVGEFRKFEDMEIEEAKNV